MKIAVLGCGPSGLVAAHAAQVCGHEVTIYSKKRKSEMFGAQYLHAPIPGMTDGPPVEVSVSLLGSHDNYRAKVYGDQADAVDSVSTEDLPPEHLAWDIRVTYENLWQAYVGRIVDRGVSTGFVDALEGEYDYVLNTIPATALCRMPDDHEFIGQPIWALGDAPERGVFALDEMTLDDRLWDHVPRNTIVCNGLPAPTWYRAANVFGRVTVEWSHTAFNAKALENTTASQVVKPISANCDCLPWVTSLGRYGLWRKGVLVHHVYEEAMHMFVEAGRG